MDDQFRRYNQKDAEHSLADVMQKMLDESQLAVPYLKHKVKEVWSEATGPVIMKFVTRMELKGDTLYVEVSSPLVKNELMMLKDEILMKMHEQIDERRLKKLVIR